jgi:N-methylhydantoinase A
LPVTEGSAAALLEDFETLYEKRYGRGSAFRAAGIEFVRFRLQASGLMPRPRAVQEASGGPDASRALSGERPMYVEGEISLRPAPIYSFDRLLPGHRFEGPAVIHTPITTVVVQPGQAAQMDGFRNLTLEVA